MSNLLHELYISLEDRYNKEPEFTIPSDEIEYLNKFGLLLDCSKGGLIIGEDGVPVIILTNNGYKYKYIQSYRYVLNSEASNTLGIDWLYQMDEQFPPSEYFDPYTVPPRIQKIEPKVVTIDGVRYKQILLMETTHLILNRNATYHALEDLDKANDKGNNIIMNN